MRRLLRTKVTPNDKVKAGFGRNVGQRELIAGGLAAFLYERRLTTVFADAAKPAF